MFKILAGQVILERTNVCPGSHFTFHNTFFFLEAPRFQDAPDIFLAIQHYCS
jgi:hypothetical protein